MSKGSVADHDVDERSYADQINAHLGSAGFASTANTKARMEEERLAGRTPKQRARDRSKAPAKKPVAYRFELETIALLKALGAKLDMNDTKALEHAVRKLAESEGVSIKRG